MMSLRPVSDEITVDLMKFLLPFVRKGHGACASVAGPQPEEQMTVDSKQQAGVAWTNGFCLSVTAKHGQAKSACPVEYKYCYTRTPVKEK